MEISQSPLEGNARARQEIAVSFTRAGQAERALQLIGEIADEGDKASALSEVAAALADAGERVTALSKIAIALSGTGQVERALELVQGSGDRENRALTFIGR